MLVTFWPQVLGNLEHMVVSKATTTPGCAVAFRKDLPHEGLLVTAKLKEIITMNLWVTKKNTPRILFVTFPDAVYSNTCTYISSSYSTKKFLELSREDSSYVLPVDEIVCFPDSFLAARIRLLELQSDDNSNKAIISFSCTDMSFIQFRTIYKVIRGQSIDTNEVI